MSDTSGPGYDIGPSPLWRAERASGGSAPLMTARVGDAYFRKPFFVDGTSDIVTVCRALADRGLDEALVRDGARLGVFTTTDLRDALLRPEAPSDLAVREVATFETCSVSVEDELCSAMLMMLRRRIRRVIVREGGDVVGVLGQFELMAFVASRSHLIAIQASEAGDMAELRAAAIQIDELIKGLHEDGVRIDVIMGVVRALNRQVFARLWTLVAPQALQDNSCLLVMGSEGRGEQVIKTDQDNALILQDGFAIEGLEGIAEAFSAALIDFGYPPCPGGIMLSRPAWRRPLAEYRVAVTDWMLGSDPEGPMKLAIFLDADVAAGDAALLAQARGFVDEILFDNQFFLARFASVVERFGAAWWTRLPGFSGRAAAQVDIKKLGIFPIVHGVRALALRYRLRDLGTADRLRALVAAGRIDAGSARDLTGALHFLIGLKLASNLRQMAEGRAPDNAVRLGDLGALERSTLKEALAIVRQFKDWLGRRFGSDGL